MAASIKQTWVGETPDVKTVDGIKLVSAEVDRYTAADFFRTHEGTQSVNASDLGMYVVTDATGTKAAVALTSFYRSGTRLVSMTGKTLVGFFWGKAA